MRSHCLTIAVALGAGAQGQVPVNPADMLHLLVSQTGQSLSLDFETPITAPPSLVWPGETYTGPGSVLNNRAYNSQYGWLANGFFNLPPGSGVFIEAQRVDRGLAFHDAFSFDPILGTDGSPSAWRWSGQMTHNWVSATRPGVYEADLLVYVGQGSTGTPLAGWVGAEVTLSWDLSWLSQSAGAVVPASRIGPLPAPGSGLALGLGGLLVWRRSR